MDEKNVLFPVEESPEFIDDGDQLDRDYHYTVAWDVEKQDFVLDGKGRMESCDGVRDTRYGAAKWRLRKDMLVQHTEMTSGQNWKRHWLRTMKRQ